MSRLRSAILAGLVISFSGLLLSLLPFGLSLEQSVGLHLLFKMRGIRKVPSDLIIVSIDKDSSERLSIPMDPEEWPRSVHARLTENLAQKGVTVIAFDIMFGDVHSKEEDSQFAKAIETAQNVVLSEKLKWEDEHFPAPSEEMSSVSFRRESLLPPIDPLAQSALALAPFPLPKVPGMVDQ